MTPSRAARIFRHRPVKSRVVIIQHLHRNKLLTYLLSIQSVVNNLKSARLNRWRNIRDEVYVGQCRGFAEN